MKAVDDFVALLDTLQDQEKAAVEAAVAADLTALHDAVGDLQQLGPKLPPFIRSRLATLTKVLQDVLAAADLVEDLYRFLNGFDPSSVQARFRFEWRPKLHARGRPAERRRSSASSEDSLVLAVDGRASGKGEMGVDVLAEIRDFSSTSSARSRSSGSPSTTCRSRRARRASPKSTSSSRRSSSSGSSPSSRRSRT